MKNKKEPSKQPDKAAQQEQKLILQDLRDNMFRAAVVPCAYSAEEFLVGCCEFKELRLKSIKLTEDEVREREMPADLTHELGPAYRPLALLSSSPQPHPHHWAACWGQSVSPLLICVMATCTMHCRIGHTSPSGAPQLAYALPVLPPLPDSLHIRQASILYLEQHMPRMPHNTPPPFTHTNNNHTTWCRSGMVSLPCAI